MFNENIDDLHDIIPSLAIMRLCAMVRDIYKDAKKPNILNEIDCQKLYLNYGDRYNQIDKVIMLIYGITEVNEYRIDEEKISIERIDLSTLSDKEKELYDKKELNEVATTKLILNTNIGELVIGYDYAFVRKEVYTPNIEISEEDKILINDDNLKFNINYPIIVINPSKQLLTIKPIINYKQFIGEEPLTHTFDEYHIDINEYSFSHVYNTKPYICDEGDKVIALPEEKIFNMTDRKYIKSYEKIDNGIEHLIMEYSEDVNNIISTNKEDNNIVVSSIGDNNEIDNSKDEHNEPAVEHNDDHKKCRIFQIILSSDYSLSYISYYPIMNDYMIEKIYFRYYGNETE